MAFDVNVITVLGNIGQDPTISVLPNSDTEVMRFGVATKHGYKRGDNWENETTWHNVVNYRPTDFEKQNIKVGTKVLVMGRLQKREYTVEGSDEKKLAVEIVATSITPLGKPEYVTNNGTSVPQTVGSAPDLGVDDDLPF